MGGKREDIALRLAVAHERVRDFKSADAIYTQLLSTDSGNVPSVQVHAAAGRYFARRGQNDLAKAEGDAVRKEDPTHPAAIFLDGWEKLQAGDVVGAEKAFNDVISTSPEAQYWEALGETKERENDKGSAEHAYEDALKLDPGYATALEADARVEMASGIYGGAMDLLAKAIAIDPDNDDNYFRLGICHFDGEHNSDKSLEWFEKAIAKNPKHGEAYFYLGKVYSDQNRARESIAALDSATKLLAPNDKNLPEAWRLLGKTYEAENNIPLKCVAYHHFMDLAAANDSMRPQVKRQLIGCPTN
jgi:tetratricopeptide (TPR) repeat protein